MNLAELKKLGGFVDAKPKEITVSWLNGGEKVTGTLLVREPSAADTLRSVKAAQAVDGESFSPEIAHIVACVVDKTGKQFFDYETASRLSFDAMNSILVEIAKANGDGKQKKS